MNDNDRPAIETMRDNLPNVAARIGDWYNMQTR